MNCETKRFFASLAGCSFELSVEGGWPNVPGRPDLETDQFIRGHIGHLSKRSHDSELELEKVVFFDIDKEIWVRHPKVKNILLPVSGTRRRISSDATDNTIVTVVLPGVYRLTLFKRGSQLSKDPLKRFDLMTRLEVALSQS